MSSTVSPFGQLCGVWNEIWFLYNSQKDKKCPIYPFDPLSSNCEGGEGGGDEVGDGEENIEEENQSKVREMRNCTGEHDAGHWEEGGEKNWQDFVAEPATKDSNERFENQIFP